VELSKYCQEEISDPLLHPGILSKDSTYVTHLAGVCRFASKASVTVRLGVLQLVCLFFVRFVFLLTPLISLNCENNE